MKRLNNQNLNRIDRRKKVRKDLIEQIPILPLLVSLFLVSASLFIFQVTITRVFSPILRYHFVFLLTSMAIFGLGVGGFIVYRLAKKTKTSQLKLNLPLWLLLLASSYILSFSLIYKLPFMNFYPLYSIIAALPFVVGGIFIANVFMLMSNYSHQLYFADLMGAGIGSLLVVVLINQWGPVNTMLVITGFAILSALLLSFYLWEKQQIVVVIGIALSFGLIGAYQPGVRQFEKRFTGYYTSPLTTLSTLRSANSSHSIKDWTWDAYSRTDVIETESSQGAKIVSIDGGSNSEMIQFDGDFSKVQHLKSDLNYLPFAVGKNEKALLIGPGGGKDILLALLAGSKDIHAVEINGGSVRIVQKYAAYNGDIYGRDEVTLHIQDGRNFVKQTNEQYDIIYLAQVMTEVAETVGYALAENYIYTKEAIKDYWNALNQEGRLAFILHDESDMTRLIFTVQESLAEAGIPMSQLSNHVVVINRGGHGLSGGTIHMPLLMIKKSPFTPEESGKLLELVISGDHQPLHLPNTGGDDFWQRLIWASKRTNQIDIGSGLNLSPTTDNRPYFFDFKSGIDPNLLILLAGVALISLIFFRPAFRRNKLKRSPFFFIGLGLGFMLIEISMILKFTLLLGHPTRSFIVILIALLTGGGLGSLVGGWPKFRFKKKYLPLVFISILTIVDFVLIETILYNVRISSLANRILVSFVLLVPLGFFMGMPFPHGLKLLKQKGKGNAVPLMWGLNGTMSIGGSVLAVIISMKIGTSYALALGGLIYLLLFLFSPLYEKNWKVSP